MIKRHFKIIDKEDFGIIYKTYVRPYLEYCLQAWSPQLQKDKKCLEKYRGGQPEWSNDLRNYQMRPGWGIWVSLDRQRLHGDLIETFKVITGKEHVNSSKFFELSDITSGLRGHSLNLFKLRCCTTIRQNFFSLRVINEWNKLPQEIIDAPPIIQEQAGQTLERCGRFQLTGSTAHQHQVQISK